MNEALKVHRETPAPMEFGDHIPATDLVLADSTRTDTYMKAVNEEERAQHNQAITDDTLQILDKQDEAKETAAMFREEIKKLKEKRKVSIEAVKHGMVEALDTIHTFLDYDTMKVHEYNSQGERILTRKMKPDEAQMKING